MQMTKKRKKNKIIHNPITYNFTKRYIEDMIKKFKAGLDEKIIKGVAKP